MNALSKDARRMPILMLVDFFRATMQQWYFQRRNAAAETTTKLTSWGDAKVLKRRLKSSKCTVHPVSVSRCQVKDGDFSFIVDFEKKECTCRKWQLSGIPCGHLIQVLMFNNYEDCSAWAIQSYHIEALRNTYEECVNPLPSPSNWEIPDGLMTVRPPLMEKRQPGRPRNTDRIPSQGEGPIIKVCSRCNERGHTRKNCTSIGSTSKGEGSRSKGKNTTQRRSGMETGSGSGTQTEDVYPTFDLNT